MKKLDRFIVTSFIGPFIAILFVVIFILMMQFLWVYIDELVGKGLGVKILAEFLFWGTCTILPLALPLSTLLAGMFGKNGKMTVSRPIMIAADSFISSYILPSALRSLMASWGSVKSGFPSFIINAYGNSKEAEPDLKLFVRHRNEGIDWDGVSSLIGVIPASVIVSSSNRKADSSVWQSAFSGLGDIPADGKLAVWTPYEQFLSLDITAMTAIQSDSIESILSLVRDSSDFIGVVPYASGRTCQGTKILPFPLPHLQFDVHFQPSARFAGTGICSLLHQSVSDSLA